MKKVFLVMLALFLFAAPAMAADQQEIVNSFHQFCDDNMARVLPTYEGNHYDIVTINGIYKGDPPTYSKKVTSIDPIYRYDVRQSNSLVSPYYGTFEVNTSKIFYKDNTNRNAAIAEKRTDGSTNWKFTFTVAYQNDSWVVTNVMAYEDLNGTLSSIPNRDIFDILRCRDPYR